MPGIPLFPFLASLLVVSARLAESRSTQHVKRADCVNPEPQNTLVNRMNSALRSSGAGFILSLCPNTNYQIDNTIIFTAHGQEISTQGYPTDDSRAMITVSSPITNGTGLATAIQGNCPDCDNIRLRNVQINGSRIDAPVINGGGNIEMGGDNTGQLVEFVRSFAPRGWSCLHIAEGSLTCTNATVQNNDIGPCGSDNFQQWADGISFACADGHVRNNMINNPTDGGIVLFGAPGTLVQNNTIWIEEQTLLGGINLVDYLPWNGNYTDVVVTNNTIIGSFADDGEENTETMGDDAFNAIIKVGIAVGPRTWFGARSLSNTSFNGTITDNSLTGGFGYGIAISSATNFTVTGNKLFGNTSFIGSRGPNCSTTDDPPATQDFVMERNTTKSSNIQSDFTAISDGNNLICIQPPSDGDYWPYGDNPDDSQNQTPGNRNSGGSGLDAGDKAGLAFGIILGVLFIAALTWFIRRRVIQKHRGSNMQGGWNQGGFTPRKF